MKGQVELEHCYTTRLYYNIVDENVEKKRANHSAPRDTACNKTL